MAGKSQKVQLVSKWKMAFRKLFDIRLAAAAWLSFSLLLLLLIGEIELGKQTFGV
jgi:lipopolysaccharide/colanic/teichoic acid biosynthesis glycosyltransferase